MAIKKLKDHASSGIVGGIEDPRYSLAREMLAVCMDTLKRHGFTKTQLASLAKEVVESSNEIPVSTKLFEDVSNLGKLANSWAEDPSYVDESGRPRVIPIRGSAPSFSSLAQSYFPGRSVAEIIRIGIEARVLERVGRYSVGHLGPCVLLTGNRTLLLGHAVRSIKWFLGTAYYNARDPEGTRCPWPERQAFAELPEGDFAEFLKVMREPIVNLTEMSNRWLMGRAAIPRHATGRKITMGVQAYIFRDT